MGVVDPVRQARDAVERRDWLAAYQALSAAGDATLHAADFVDLATAAYLLCRHDDCVTALQRAHQAYVAAGETGAAVRTAFWLSLVLRQHGEGAVANGWIHRAERLAEELPEESVEHGYVEYARLMRDVFSGRIDETTTRPAAIVERGRRSGDPNLVAAGLMSSGRRAIYAGRADEGLALLDEAIVCLLSGGLTPIIAGQVLCSAIEGCQELWELQRAAEWTAALETWCDEQEGLEMFTGTCRLHKGQVLAASGSFPDAVRAFEEAIGRFERGGANPRVVGMAFAELGDALRASGDLEGASVALCRAVQLGCDPAPEQALLDLACGRGPAAAAAALRLLETPARPVRRAQALARIVGVLLAGDDLAAASRAVAELSRLADEVGTPVFRAHAARARGLLALATGQVPVALAELGSALAGFVDGAAAYEAARTRLALAEALDADGDGDAAARERDHASRVLGAPRAADRPGDAGLLTGRQVEVLRLVAAGRSNREIARELQLSEKTVARHLSNIFVALGVTSRTGAAAYGFEHGLLGEGVPAR